MTWAFLMLFLWHNEQLLLRKKGDWDHANTIFYYFITHLGVFRKAENCL
ncbi:hypothetical protein SGGBAA2069_c19810 [Streptococcus gallolyticus subsp. gallolyticus ATCC BAA-2069]|nr:hypothetical protein SGGBAA2069_c19810 [Streptococcus gallolyticus subsp. gallolyticus ATCC BAA-2069]